MLEKAGPRGGGRQLPHLAQGFCTPQCGKAWIKNSGIVIENQGSPP
jgi:hypothetical protein